jgi:capsular exopolysaccharide synthesis family protein
LIGIVVVAIFVARRVATYSNPVYQTDASMMIDNRDFGISNFYLFNEEGGPKKSLSSIFLTEVELLKTRSIKEKTFRKLDFDVRYYRVGKIRKSQLYNDSPFKVEYKVFEESAFGKEYMLEYIGKDTFAYLISEKERPAITFNKDFTNEKLTFKIKKNEVYWKEKADNIQIGDKFAFKLLSMDDLIGTVNSENLFIKPIDKEITIIKVYVKDEIPEKAALFCNTFINTYIEEARSLKSNENSNTLNFVNAEIERVERRLKDAEGNLALYKQSEKLVNMNQETDATLKELTALDLRLVDFEIQEVELNAVLDFLMTESNISDFSPNFKTISDKVFEDAFIKLKGFELQREDLLQNYTQTSSEVQNVQQKISDLRAFSVQTIEKKLSNITGQRKQIEGSIETINAKLRKFPDKQRKIAGLEREVNLAAQTYTFLTQKKMELGIAQSSDLIFHRVLDYAKIPIMPISPNIPLIYGMFIFVALIVSLIIIFIRHYFVNTIESKDELKIVLNNLPVISSISDIDEEHKDDIEPFLNIYTNINILQKEASANDDIDPWLITLSSIMPNEGRTYIVSGLGRVMAHFDRKTLIVDLDNRKPKLHEDFGIENSFGVADFLRDTRTVEDAIQTTGIDNLDILAGGDLTEMPEELVFSPKMTDKLKELKKYYDVIIVDTPPTAVHIESVALMHESDLTLYSIQAYKSRVRFVKYINTFIEEYKIPNFYLVLNGIRQTSGFYAKSYRLGFRRRLIRFLKMRF